MDEASLRAQIVTVAARLYDRGYIVGVAGNLSARLPGGDLLVTPAGLPKAELSPAQLVVVDPDGKPVRLPDGLQPSSELPMHLEAYRQRPDVGAVVHAHPETCIALTLTGISLERSYLPEAEAVLGPVPTAKLAMPSSEENQAAIAGLIGKHNAILLAHHGSLTVGRTLEEAFDRLEVLEHTARIVAKAHQLGHPRELPADIVARLRASGARL